MKKLIIAAAMALCAFASANAQRFGVTAGLNVSTEADSHVDALPGFNAGGVMDYSLKDTKLGDFFLEGKLLYSAKGFKNQETGDKNRLHYIELPVAFGHNFKLGSGDISIAPKFGIYFACGVAGKDPGDNNPFKDYGDYSYKRFDFGIGTGVNFNFAQNWQAGLGYEWGCVQMQDGWNDSKNHNFNVNIAYFFE